MLRKTRIRLLILITLVTAAGTIWASVFFTGRTHAPGVLRVAFFDVGQGDAAFIESPTGTQVLIDGGASAAVLRELSRELGFFDRTVDMVVVTHSDLDHIGGLIDVLRRYRVASVLMTENTGETEAAASLRAAIAAEGGEVVMARRGMAIDLGGGAQLRVLFPDRDPSLLESNTSSIVARLTHGEGEFLFTGDSPQSVEEYLVALYGEELRSDVLKVGHHGSRTSSSPVFLSAVDPAFAVISAGKDNRYGHPHREVLDALSAEGAQILSTAEGGTIIFESDSSFVVRVR